MHAAGCSGAKPAEREPASTLNFKAATAQFFVDSTAATGVFPANRGLVVRNAALTGEASLLLDANNQNGVAELKALAGGERGHPGRGAAAPQLFDRIGAGKDHIGFVAQ
ncbi:unnamed protein product, partial [Symbiodinium sp. KB8]